MAFLLYSTVRVGEGSRSYEQAGNYSLAGNRTGLIYKACRDLLGTSDTVWTVSSGDLLNAGGWQSDALALVTDISPGRKGEVNLLEIKRISGISYSDWTPIMLEMDTLPGAQEVSAGGEHSAKQNFVVTDARRESVVTFLYLRGGYADGSWQFGPIGGVNAPLLRPDALQFFSAQMART